MRKAYLVLADGTVYEGKGFGAEVERVGELVFTTGMTGYIETLTDPSYAGQIVLQTFPLIGNYGIIPEDFEGECHVKGYVVREWCETPSNFRMSGTVDAFLKERGIPGICGIDTRAVTRRIRTSGVMNAMICAEVPQSLEGLKDYRVENVVQQVTRLSPAEYPAQGKARFRVALIDYGAKQGIIRELCARGCAVTAYPASVSAETVLAAHPDGVMLSNGPGDPA
ncbi:MAG: carbamoyl phosphate synthase small subunit, partial [Clostridia bacterium]|nr:carbamoyl phosphate synthase small subunit [Clostridia bacterium]